ncbi:MAG TPA: PA domain-containing protein [Polyangiales bacterium]|nr:PA domain-containing protein [Polyangiales bacterium]
MKRALLMCIALAWASRVQARADFVLVTDGDGFADATPVQPVGSNAGSTRGEQRRRALARALEIWGAALDSAVPIVVRASFPDLGCTDNGAVLGQAYAVQFMRNLPGTSASSYYPSALADRIAGSDVSPGMPDLAIELNAGIDESKCEQVAGHWYYGVDGKTPSGENDLIQIALHELAHGLGFSSSIDPRTGRSQFEAGVDVFTEHMLDLDQDEHWDALTASERVSSASNVRRLVFDGESARVMARELLGTGVPTLRLEPMPAGISLTRAVSDVELATNAAKAPVSGPLVLASPTDACTGPNNDVRGAVVLLENGPDCAWQDGLANITAAGAVGAVFLVSAPATSPAEPLDAYGYGSASTVRAVTVAAETGLAIFHALQRGAITATLDGEPSAILGADAQGRPLLFASQPGLPGSSLSHFDSLARPNLLMEAYIQGGSNHDVDLTLAVLRDIGWERRCGNGELDADEQCDLGSANSDAAGTQCRTNCRTPSCGDGVKAGSEACDDGAANSDSEAGACRTTCEQAHCGDGVMDPGEVCDQGIANNDLAPNTCRTRCILPRCGDGVVDTNESCDGTRGCSDSCQSVLRDAGPDAASLVPWTEPIDTEPEAHGEGCALGVGGEGSWLLLLLALRRRRPRS